MPITQILLTATTAQGGGGGGGGGGDTYPAPGSGSYSATGGTQGVAGIPYDPGGGIDTVSNSENGWAYYIKDGRFNNDTTFFNGVTKTGADTYGGFGFQNLPKDEYAFQWVGYLPAPTTGDYNIVLSSDDLLYFWIGTNALEGNYNFSNYHALTNNNSQFAQHSLSLTAGKYYPVRMWFQEWSGAERAQVFFGLVGGTVTAMNDWAIVNNSLTEGH
jgi:hypothetical protein